MKLRRVQLRSYRAYQEADADLPEAGLVLLIGANNAGKSALLSAIDLIAGRAWPGPVRHAGSEQPATVTATFELSDEERGAAFAGSPRQDEWLASPAMERVELRFEEILTGHQFLLAQVAVSDGQGDMPVVGTGSYDGARTTFSCVDLSSVFQQLPPHNSYPAPAAAGDVSAFQPEFVLDQGMPLLREPLSEWRAGVFHFSAQRPGTDRVRPLSLAGTLDPGGTQLAEALAYLFMERDPDYGKIEQTMNAIVPELGQLVVPPAGPQQIEVAFEDPHLKARHNLKDLGTGVEQALLSAYVGIRQPRDSVVMVEEPETNLHPAAQRELLRCLKEWSGDRLYIASTHSTVFLDQGAEDATVLLVERSEGVSTVRESNTAMPEVLRSVGARPSDVLSAERVLFVEGESDAEILRVWFPELLLRRGTVVVSAGGGDEAWKTRLVERLVEVADELERNMLFLRDRDELDAASVERLERSGVVSVLPRRELENYLLEPVAIAAVLNALHEQAPTSQSRVVSEQHVTEAMRKIADQHQSTVVLKTVAQRAPRRRVLDRAAVREIVGGPKPSREATLEAVRARLPERATVFEELRRLWDQAATEIEADWNEGWLSRAPGEEVLAGLWSDQGRAYDKLRDGMRLAQQIRVAPDEIVERIEGFVLARAAVS